MATYDDQAAEYDQHDYPTTSHEEFVRRLLETCPPGGIVLDAPCGYRQLLPDWSPRPAGEAFATLTKAGKPVVRGEVIEGDVAGYHYYPGRDQVMRWLAEEGMVVGGEGYD